MKRLLILTATLLLATAALAQDRPDSPDVLPSVLEMTPTAPLELPPVEDAAMAVENEEGALRLWLDGSGALVIPGSYVDNSSYSTVSGGGTRLMWLPERAAFRAGRVQGAQWDSENVGSYSFATGFQTTASELYSTAMGVNTTASGASATALGSGTTAMGQASIATGSNSEAIGNFSTAMGTRARALHNGTFVWADNIAGEFASTGAQQYLIRAGGGVGINTNTPGDFDLAVDGDIGKRFGDTFSPAAPVAYGRVSSSAVANATDNVASVVWNATASRYEIEIDNESYSWTEYAAVITPFGNTAVVPLTSSSGGKLHVTMTRLDGETVQSGFHFVVYKP